MAHLTTIFILLSLSFAPTLKAIGAEAPLQKKITEVVNEFWSYCITKNNLTRGELMVCIATTQIGNCDDQNNAGSGVFSEGQIDYTDGNPQAWCSEFVSWVHHAADFSYQDSSYGGDNDWLLANVSELMMYYSDRNSYSGDFDYSVVPTKGSWVSLMNGTHSGLVIGSSGPDLYTIEGNVGGCVMARVRKNYADDPTVLGFGMDNCVPEFNFGDDSLPENCNGLTNFSLSSQTGISWAEFQKEAKDYMGISATKLTFPKKVKTAHDIGANLKIFLDQ